MVLQHTSFAASVAKLFSCTLTLIGTVVVAQAQTAALYTINLPVKIDTQYQNFAVIAVQCSLHSTTGDAASNTRALATSPPFEVAQLNFAAGARPVIDRKINVGIPHTPGTAGAWRCNLLGGDGVMSIQNPKPILQKIKEPKVQKGAAGLYGGSIPNHSITHCVYGAFVEPADAGKGGADEAKSC